MSVLVMRVIIRRGTLMTDTIIMLGRLSLPLRVIRGSSRGVGSHAGRRVGGVGLRRRISMGLRWRIIVRGLSMRSGRS